MRVLFAILALFSLNSVVSAGIVAERISAVFSGNTFRLSNGTIIRMVYVDPNNNPHEVLCAEPEATRLARSLLAENRVFIKELGLDEDGTTLCRVMLNGKDFVHKLHDEKACRVDSAVAVVLDKDKPMLLMGQGGGVQALTRYDPDANGNRPESYWQRSYNDLVANGATEVPVQGGRVDILTPDYAIEVDRASKWHEAIGQALHYAEVTGKKPLIALYDDGSAGAAEKIALARKIALSKGIKFDVINPHIPTGYEPMNIFKDSAPSLTLPSSRSKSSEYQVGPRGGRYRINSSGNKVYDYYRRKQ